MRVAILHNAVTHADRADARDVLAQVDAVRDALRVLAHESIVIPCDLDLEALRTRLVEAGPDAAFNLVESLGGMDRLIHLVPALLEALGVPFTGSSAQALCATTDKIFAKERLAAAGLPTPAWWTDGDPGRAAALLRPGARVIIKPALTHASAGIDDGSIFACAAPDDLVRAMDARGENGPWLAEEFIDGREFNLSLLSGPGGVQVLPPAEIRFDAFPPGKPRIVGYAAKWEELSFEYNNTPRSFDFSAEDRPLIENLSALALDCWTLFGLSGFARVDFRVDAAGRPWVLEINANPCLSPDCGFTAAAGRAGISFAQAVGRVLDAALRRSAPRKAFVL
jgi:D-alanine-D-alanine ligase